ncbi:hypothetical protein NT6N_02880 [Oceaniferula spumae]|uniref:Uncharacterized protein n=1 Tax=Oceaniferula spumae TaxID=2979115 RepID=A0AAT9FGY2_9BACT
MPLDYILSLFSNIKRHNIPLEGRRNNEQNWPESNGPKILFWLE